MIGSFLGMPLALMTVPPTSDQFDQAHGVDDELTGAIVAFSDNDARMTVPVSIANNGPYEFVIDTGAERTVISRELARRLDLAAGQKLDILSMSGRDRVDSVLINALKIASLQRSSSVQAPALGALDLGTLGLLGVDALSGTTVAIDFDKNVMTVQPSISRSRREQALSQDIVVTAKSVMGQLIITDAEYEGHAIRVIIDTGSPLTVANSAMRRLTARRTGSLVPIELISATGAKISAMYSTVGSVRLGEVRLTELPVAFAEVAPFERFSLSKRPAMLLSMSALRSFRRVEIDFANRQIRFHMPRAG